MTAQLFKKKLQTVLEQNNLVYNDINYKVVIYKVDINNNFNI